MRIGGMFMVDLSRFAALVATGSLLLAGCAAVPPKSGYHLRKVAEDSAGGGDSAISPDGRRFVTSLKRNGNWDVWVYDLIDNTWSRKTHDSADDFEGQWSPDGAKIVFTSTRKGNKDIFLLTLSDGSVRQLSDDPEDDEYPNFSPDGRSITYTGGKWLERNFYVVGIDGNERRVVSAAPGKAGACSFPRFGQFLICHSYDSGMGNVYLQPLSGARPIQITSGRVWDYKPTMSPDGNWIAFSRSVESPSAIYVMPFPGGDAFPLTESGADDRWPTWSADGDKLLFHRLIDRGNGLRIYDRTRGTSKTIVGPDLMPGQASFSPDGQQIVFSSASGNREELVIRDLATGQDSRPLPGVEASFPRWSPDGKRLAFCLRTRSRWEVATADADGANLRSWSEGLQNVRSIKGPVDWAPDSRHVVFHASAEPFEANLYIVDTGTGLIRNVTSDHWFSEAPSFTPDGKSMLFMSTRGGNWTWGFFRLPLDNGPAELLAGPDYTEKDFPRPGPHGGMVWSEYDAGETEYLAEKAAGGKAVILKSAGAWSRWPSYSPDGNSILYTSIEHRVEYWLAEGLTAPDSPLRRRPVVSASNVAPDPDAAPHHTASRSSPVELHHR